jgi:fatty-acid desaturase
MNIFGTNIYTTTPSTNGNVSSFNTNMWFGESNRRDRSTGMFYIDIVVFGFGFHCYHSFHDYGNRWNRV